jgi:hypothetical protein
MYFEDAIDNVLAITKRSSNKKEGNRSQIASCKIEVTLAVLRKKLRK